MRPLLLITIMLLITACAASVALSQGLPLGVSLFIIGANQTEFDFDLDWNLASLQIIPNDTNVSRMLTPILGKYISVHYYNATDMADHWKVYNPSLPIWVTQDLTNLDEKKGFWIRINESVNLTVNGSQNSYNDIPIQPDWNMVGYPSLFKRNVTVALTSIWGNFSSVHMYNATDMADHWKVYNPALPDWVVQDLLWLVPKHGYWIRGNDTDTWRVE
ncbi:hypothetical protein JXB02_02825 [Candidatus Woesearchaeota archaeon]|nr:hypothetical protein [Candidatus Woesearchaeota archaeon]